MKRSLGFGLVVAVAMTCSCGGSSDSDGTPSSGPTIDEVPALLAQVYCDLMQTCMGPAFTVFMADQDCKTKVLPGIEDGTFAGMKAAIEKGTVKYDASKAQACIDAMKAEGCAISTKRSPDICKQAIAGTVATGGDCTVSAECTGDDWCKGDTCPGKCAPREAAGVACRDDDACRDGMKCAIDQCAVPLAANATCTDSDQCDITTVCFGANASTSTSGTCRPASDVFKAKSGEACDLAKGQLCEAGLSCVIDQVSANPTYKCTPVSAAGAACRFGAPEPCPTGQYCAGIDLASSPPKLDGTCTASPGDGQACAGALGSACETGAVCDDTKVCRKPQHIGGACVNNTACYSGICQSGTCIAGTSCTPGTP
jgi:hypothetical protein